MADTKIYDVRSLEKAIAELEMKKIMLEEKLDANGEHLQKHFFSMAVKSVMPENAFESGPVAAASNFLKSDKLKDGFIKIVTSVTNIANEGLESVINKFKSKKPGGDA